MSDLREELARRLHGIARAESGTPAIPPFPFAYSLKMADECIRQMEWARQQSHPDLVAGMSPLDIGLEDLTPAPKDWKP